MVQYKERYELKNIAKNKLDGKYRSAVLICLIASLLAGLISSFISGYVPASKNPAVYYAVQGITSFALSWLIGVFNLGVAYFFLNAACGFEYSCSNLFYCFRADTATTLSISGIRALIHSVCLLPAQYLMDFFYYTKDIAFLAAAVAAAVFGFAFYIYAGLGVSLAFFLQLDFPDKSAGDIIRQSFHLMRGNRKRFFLLQLSFFPLDLLCVLSLFIGYLWLEPYRNMTYACFFLDIMNPQAKKEQATRPPLD